MKRRGGETRRRGEHLKILLIFLYVTGKSSYSHDSINTEACSGLA